MSAPARTRCHIAFSLVEVVLAIGIVAFALSAMFGLLAVSLQSNRDSAYDTDLVAMSRQVLSNLRATPYSSLPDATNFYFDEEGVSTPAAQALYECSVVLTDDATVPAGSLKQTRLTFTWPVAAGTHRPHTNIFHMSLANHGD